MALPVVGARVGQPARRILQAVDQILVGDRRRGDGARRGRGGARFAAQRSQIADDVGQVGVVQPRGRILRHQRGLLVDHFPQVRFPIALDPLARVHHLDAEHVFRLLRAAHALAVFGDDGDGFKRGGDPLGRRADLAGEGGVRSLNADARQIRAEAAAAAGHAMARRALLREQPLAVRHVADRPLRRRDAHAPQIRDDLQDVLVDHFARRRRHFSPGDALANRVEDPLVGQAGHGGDQIGAAIARGVESMTVAAAQSIDPHAAADRFAVAEMRVAGGRVARGRRLRDEQRAETDEGQRRKHRRAGASHRSLLKPTSSRRRARRACRPSIRSCRAADPWR